MIDRHIVIIEYSNPIPKVLVHKCPRRVSSFVSLSVDRQISSLQISEILWNVHYRCHDCVHMEECILFTRHRTSRDIINRTSGCVTHRVSGHIIHHVSRHVIRPLSGRRPHCVSGCVIHPLDIQAHHPHFHGCFIMDCSSFHGSYNYSNSIY